ncbi:UNVERIFIED_CONTAM: hypothetical protein FKN15_069422 [Acipenser sinensis]
MLLKAAWRAPAQSPQQREPAPPGAEEQELPLPPCSHCSSFAAGDRGGGPETCSHCSSFAAGDRGGGPETCSHCSSFAAGDRGGGPETCSHCSSFAAGDRGGGLETCSHCSFFAAGSTVAGAPQRGATGYEESGRGQETSIPRSNFAAGLDQHAVSRATTGRGADSMASHGPSEASLPSPRLFPGLLGF